VSFTAKRPLVCLITDGSLNIKNYASGAARLTRIIEAAVRHKIPLVQIREKGVPARLVHDLVGEATALTRGSSTRLLVNDRADIAIAAGADGVQLTEASMAPDVVRGFAPEGFIIGVSTHSLDGAMAARSGGADFALFGTVFPSPGKGTGVGLDELARVCSAAAPFPVLAVGGIDAANYNSVLDAGAAGFAAIRYLNDAEEMQRLARELDL
jgi:thiamine-phosphate pyrophosphorylase